MSSVLCRKMWPQMMAAIAGLLFAGSVSHAQEPQRREPYPGAVFRGDPAQLKPIKDRIWQIYASAKRTKAISDADLAFILETANNKEFPALLVVEAMKPLARVKMGNLAPRQKEQVISLYNGLLSADDSKADPEGAIKMYVTMFIRQSFRDKRLLPLVDKLRQDSRKHVRNSAEQAAAALR